MVDYLFWVGSFVLLGLILAADYVWTRFHHTPRSRRVLAAMAAVEYLVALLAVLLAVRPGRWFASLVWALCLWVPLYLLSALAAVETWRHRKLSTFDRAIAQLRRDAAHRLDALDRMAWEIRDLERRSRGRHPSLAEVRAPEPRVTDRSATQRERVELWRRAGGLARVRSLKVGEWEAELAVLDEPGLRARESELENGLREEAAGDRREQIEVQLALVRIQLGERSVLRVPAAAAAEPVEREPADGSLDAARRRRTQEEEELARIRSEIERRQRERAAFLRQRIQLD